MLQREGREIDKIERQRQREGKIPEVVKKMDCRKKGNTFSQKYKKWTPYSDDRYTRTSLYCIYFLLIIFIIFSMCFLLSFVLVIISNQANKYRRSAHRKCTFCACVTFCSPHVHSWCLYVTFCSLYVHSLCLYVTSCSSHVHSLCLCVILCLPHVHSW